MKKFKLPIIIVLTFLIIFSLTACKSDIQTDDTTVPVVYRTVSFATSGGSEIPAIRVLDGGTATAPANPTRDGYIFDCWIFEGKEWSFAVDKVTADITLTAQWIDSASVYSYIPIEGAEGQACITGLKRELAVYEIPTTVKGLTVSAIGDGVFAEKESDKTTKIILPDTVSSVGRNSFYKCENIEIVVNGALIEVGEAAFYNCNFLKKITLGEGLVSLSAQAFEGCTSLSEVTLPSTLEDIGEDVFNDCIALVEIRLPKALKAIGNGAFVGCDALENVYFGGTTAEWDSITVDGQNHELTSAKLHTEG